MLEHLNWNCSPLKEDCHWQSLHHDKWASRNIRNSWRIFRGIRSISGNNTFHLLGIPMHFVSGSLQWQRVWNLLWCRMSEIRACKSKSSRSSVANFRIAISLAVDSRKAIWSWVAFCRIPAVVQKFRTPGNEVSKQSDRVIVAWFAKMCFLLESSMSRLTERQVTRRYDKLAPDERLSLVEVHQDKCEDSPLKFFQVLDQG